MYTSTHDTDTLAGHFPGRPLWPLLELALSSPRCARGRAGPGRARAGLDRADEPSGRDRRQLGLEARARSARPGRGRKAAGLGGGVRPCVTSCAGLRSRASRSTHRCPRSGPRRSCAELAISPGHHVLDLGCGWGELLLRMSPLTLRPRARESTATVSRSTGAAARVAARAAGAGRVRRGRRRNVRSPRRCDPLRRGLPRVGWRPRGARSIRRLIDHGGLALYGDGFWATPPSAEARAAIGELPTHGHLLGAIGAAGFRIEQADVVHTRGVGQLRAHVAIRSRGVRGRRRRHACGRAEARVRGRLPRGVSGSPGSCSLRLIGASQSSGSTGSFAATTFCPSSS